jgi:hypothetical protein
MIPENISDMYLNKGTKIEKNAARHTTPYAREKCFSEKCPESCAVGPNSL